MSPAGWHYLATLTAQDSCTLWDLAEERPLPLPGGDQPVSSVTWSPDGQWLVLGTTVGTVEIYSVPAGTLVDRVEHRGRITALAFSTDGTLLAVASDVVRVWDCANHRFVTPELHHPKPVLRWRFPLVVSGWRLAARMTRLRVYAIRDRESNQDPMFPPVEHRVRSQWFAMPIAPTFIDQDRRLLTVAGSNEIALWDAGTGKQTEMIVSQVGTPNCVTVSPDGQYLAVGGSEAVMLWDITTSSRVDKGIKQLGGVLSAAFSPDGASLVVGSLTARVWSVPDGNPLGPVLYHQYAIPQTAFSPDGKFFMTVQGDGLVRIWSSVLGNLGDRRLALDGQATAVKVSRDGQYLVPTGSSCRFGNLRSTRVYDVSTFTPAGPPLEPRGVLTDADLSPNGRQAVTVNAESELDFWDWHTGQRTFDSVPLPSEPRAVGYSSDGLNLFVVCAGDQVLAIDPATGQVTMRLQSGVEKQPAASDSPPSAGSREHGTPDWRSGRNYLDFTPHRFLVCGSGRLIRVSETATGVPCFDPLQHDLDTIFACFSPDARHLLTTAWDAKVRVWDVATGRPMASPLLHPNMVPVACFSPDGEYILTGCEDNMARLWQWRTGILVSPPFEHSARIADVCFTPDGLWMLTASLDSTARVWERCTGKPVTPPVALAGMAGQVITTTDNRHAIVSGVGAFIDVIDLGDLYDRDDLDLADLGTLAEVLSSQRVHVGGDVVNLTADEWLHRWRQFRDRHPGYLDSPWSNQKTIAWHRREANKSITTRHWFAAVWHLDRLVLQEPENWQHYYDRSRLYRGVGGNGQSGCRPGQSL